MRFISRRGNKKDKTLDFLMIRSGKKSDKPKIYIQVVLKKAIPNYPDAVSLTPDCGSYKELELQVKVLKSELDDVLKRGRTEITQKPLRT